MTSGGNAIIREAVAHVLIIDDDPSVILTLSRMLEFEG
jgi:CheY-like chemotaxis protein